MLEIGGKQGQTVLYRRGCDQRITQSQPIRQRVLVDQVHGALADGVAQGDDFCAAPAQGILQSREVRPIAATLHKFNVGDNAVSPNMNGAQSCRRTGMSTSEPDDDIRIDQHRGQPVLREPSGL